MPETFSTPAGSPVVAFSGQIRTFPRDTSFSANKQTFSTPAGSPVVAFSGQKRAFSG